MSRMNQDAEEFARMKSYLPPEAADYKYCAEGCKYYGSVKKNDQVSVCKANEAYVMAVKALELVKEVLEPEKKCEVCEEFSLEGRDTLYQLRHADCGTRFERIKDIKYCPVCGRDLLVK